VSGPRAGGVALVLLARFAPRQWWWSWSRLVLQDWPLRGVPQLRFAKVLGSGHNGGFGLRPSASVQGLLLGFEDEAAAHQFVQHSSVTKAYQRHSQELALLLLRAYASKGSWSGAAFDVAAQGPPAPGLAVVSLTRASIKPHKAWPFWRMSPAAQASLGRAAGCELAVGLGEAPLLRQCTFSLWRDEAALNAYARSGAHLQAIKAAQAGAHFSESMFVRFVPAWAAGRWQGRDVGLACGIRPALGAAH
jgi:hypothetical protein